jgi:signal peptidase II
MKRKYWILLVVALSTLILDQITKQWVHVAFHLGETLPVIEGYFNLTYVRNTGAAFGLLANADPAFRIPFFLSVPVIALFAIGAVFRKVSDKDLRMILALSLVIGGATGNLIDRAIYNFVIDFLDFHWRYSAHFPAFNVADIAICVGVGLMMLDMLMQPEPKKAE